jgi:RHS repeat-associated protein
VLGLALLLSGVVHADSVTYVYTDPQGTPLANADVNGNITATFDYAPYGSIALGTAPNGPGYTGHVNDTDTGFIYMQARYYDPSVGRFLSADPATPSAGTAFNFNRYDYASNSPIVNTDPSGRASVGEIIDANAQSSADAGDKAATFGWAFAGVAWNALGAESVSQVADKGGAASTGDKIMAAVAIVTLGKGEEAVTFGKDVAQVAEDGAKEAISMSEAVDKAVAHTGSDAEVGMTKGGNVQFSKSATDQSGNTITKNARFDVNPANAHVQKQGLHLIIKTHQNGKTIQNDHFLIDPKTIQPGDHD